MSHIPLLTIAIPSYNGAAYINETLNSIIPQLEDGVEVLISDNASTDNLAEIIVDFQRKLPTIKYFYNRENVGADKNFDLAIRRASGKYVWLFSDDDLLEPGAIKHLMKVLRRHKTLAHIFINYSTHSIDLDTCYSNKTIYLESDMYFHDGEEYINLVKFSPIFMPSNIFKRQLWLDSKKDAYVGTGWIHYGVLVSSVKNLEAYCIAFPYIKLRTRAVWTSHGALWKHTLSLSKIIQGISSYGYTQATVDNLMSQFTQKLIHTFIASKRDGLQFSLKIVIESTQEFFKYPKFWIFILPAFFVPNFIIVLALKAHKKIRSLFSGAVRGLHE